MKIHLLTILTTNAVQGITLWDSFEKIALCLLAFLCILNAILLFKFLKTDAK